MTLEPTTPSGDEPSHRSSPRGGPGLHPDRDALADYAAEVLTESDADAVREHVETCATCCEDLAAMDAVRDLLLADDPGPMPDDVWARLSAALEAEAGRASGSPAETDTEQDDVPPADVRPLTVVAARAESVPGSGLTVLRRPEPVTSARGGRRLFAPGRRMPLLAAAAGFGVLLTGLGVVVHELTPRGGSSAVPTAEMVLGAQERSELASVVHTTGRDYTKAGLQSQVAALLGGAKDMADAPAAGSDQPDVGRPGPSGAGTSTSTDPLIRGASGPQVLRDPTALSRCLTSLGLPADQVVAVDLASFEGREAAVVVSGVPGSPTLDVYAVSRNCGVEGSDDGAFTFARVKR